MNVQVKSCSGITLMPLETRLLADRMVFIEGEINHEKACEFVKALLVLCRTDSSRAIDVMINSPGGELNAGLLMYDCIQSCQTPIRMYCIGRAYSMAAVLFACGNHKRYMLQHSELMLHEPMLGSCVGGNASSIRSISDSLMETRQRMNQLLAKHTGKTENEIEEATSYDHYFSAEESISFGLADEVVRFDELMEV